MDEKKTSNVVFEEVDVRRVQRLLQVLALGGLLEIKCRKCGSTVKWGVNNIAMAVPQLLEESSVDFNCPHCQSPLMMYHIELGKVMTLSLFLLPGIELIE